MKLGNEEEKEVMRKKNRLKRDQIFIENDLTWEEKKIQERIWVKERRNKGEDVKVGFGKVRERNMEMGRGWRGI